MNTPDELGHPSSPTAWALCGLIADSRAAEARATVNALTADERDAVLMTLAHGLALASTLLLTEHGTSPDQVAPMLLQLSADQAAVPADPDPEATS